MAGQMYRRGDRVKVTLEGEVTRVMDIEPGSETVELRIEHNGRASFVYTDMATVEKVEPPVETFGPGAVVRDKVVHSARYAIGNGGYFSFTTNEWHDDPTDFTTDRYERVEVS